jgi:4-diphosphocytidyl-2C-methyl-D-erythritol kinase
MDVEDERWEWRLPLGRGSNNRATATARNPRLSGAGPTFIMESRKGKEEIQLVKKGGGAKHCQFWTGGL